MMEATSNRHMSECHSQLLPLFKTSTQNFPRTNFSLNLFSNEQQNIFILSLSGVKTQQKNKKMKVIRIKTQIEMLDEE